MVPHAFPRSSASCRLAAPDLRGTPTRLCAALGDVATSLRRGEITGSALQRLAERLHVLTRHPDDEVRREVARASQFLRHELFDDIVAILVDDTETRVREEAQASLVRRRERAQAELFGGENDRAWTSLLAQVEQAYGAAAQRALLAAAQRQSYVQLRAFRHELVRIVTPLLLTLERLERDLRGTRSHALAIRAGARADLLRGLSRALLDLSAVNDDPFESECLRHLLEEAIGLVRDGAGPLRPRLRVTMDVPLRLRADVRKRNVLLAFRNVLQNGLEASHADGEIRLEVRARTWRRDRVAIRFRDFGIGMPPEVKRDAFALFSTIKAGGTGVGLTIVRKVVEAEHAGTVRLADNPARGTDVILVLPKTQRPTRS